MQTLRIEDIHLIYLVRNALERERKLMETGIEITRQNLAYFENRFQMLSEDFYKKYQSGETDDDTDAMRWAAEIQAFQKLTGDYQKLTEIEIIS